MTQQRDAIDNPVTGETIVFLKRAGDTDGQVLQMELLLKADGPRMLEHVHPRQEERIEVLSGTLRFRLGGEEQELGAGQALVLPPGVPHTLWNVGEGQARCLFDVRPALKTEAAFETLFGLAREGKTNKQGMPNPLQGALLAREYETFLPRPPVPLQRVVLATIAPIARLFGYRARYAKYSGSE